MLNTHGDSDLHYLSDVKYEIRKWLLEYELLSREIIRLRDELSRNFPFSS